VDLGKETLIQKKQPELVTEKPTSNRSVIGDILYQSNPIVAFAKNKTGNLKDYSQDIPDPNFSWESPETKEMLKGVPFSVIQNLDPDINNYESLRAALARQEELKEASEHTNNALGAWNIPANLATGIVTDPTTLFGGALWKGAETAAHLYQLNKLQKVSLGVGAGLTEAVAYDRLQQGTMMTEDKEATMFSLAFGGTIGGLLGRYTLDIHPNVSEGTTATDRIVHGLTKGKDSQEAKQVEEMKLGHITGTNGVTIITPIGRLYGSKSNKAVEFANKMVTPPKALKDKEGNLVVTGETAENIKSRLERESEYTQHTLDIEYGEAKKTHKFNGDRTSFNNEVLNVYIGARTKAEKELHSNINLKDIKLPEDFKVPPGLKGKELERFITEAKIKQYLSETPLNIKYTHSNPSIVKAANHLANYFNKMAVELKSSGMKGMEHIKPNGHLPQSFNVARMEANKEDFIARLKDSMSKHLGNFNKKDEDIAKEAEAVYEHILDVHYMRPVKNRTQHTKTTNRRTLSYFTDDMRMYINDDVNEIISKYSRDTSGRIAVQKSLGFESVTDFEDYVKSFGRELSETELRDMKVVYDSIIGTREVPNANGIWDTTLRLTTKASRTVFSPGFALAGAAELATPVATAGLLNVVKGLLPSFKSAMELIKGKPLTDPLVQEMMQLRLVGDIVSARQLQRYDAEDTMHTPLKGFLGGFEKVLDKANHGIHKYLGLGYITEVGQMVSNISGINWMFQVAKKKSLSLSEEKALARIGISRDDLQKLHKQRAYVQFNEGGNTITKLNTDKWDSDILDKFTRAIQNHTDSTILKPNGTNIPVWMSDPNSPLAKLTMQFTRYPMAAHEKLAMRGLDEANINQVISIATSSALFVAISQIKDLGRDKPLFDLDTEEGRKRAYLYAVSQTYMFGSSMLAIEKLASAAGYSITGDRAPGMLNVIGGASGSMLQGAQTTVHSVIDEDKEFKTARSINPIQHMWMYNMAIGAYNKAIGK